MRVAIIEDNIITNIVEAVSIDSVQAMMPTAEVADLTALPTDVGRFWVRVDGEWMRPENNNEGE